MKSMILIVILVLTTVLTACTSREELSAIAVKNSSKECINGVLYYSIPTSYGYYTLTAAFKTDSTVYTCN